MQEGLTDCVVVCTRYFGGILLGTGGLVRAYGATAKIAVEKAGIVTMSLCAEGELVCDYTLYGKLQPLLLREGAVLSDTVFEDAVTLRFSIPCEQFDRLNAQVVDASFGKCSCRKLGEAFAPIDG